MIKMVLPFLDGSDKSDAKRKVFNLIKNAGLNGYSV